MDKLTAIKIKYDDGTYSDEIPVSVLSENVEWDNTHTLVDVLGSIDVDVTGTIQGQISQLFNGKVSTSEYNNLVNRVNNLIALPDGATKADAELVDIRVKADGTSTATAGNAVREQFTELKSDLRQDQTAYIECESGTYEDSDGATKSSRNTRIRNVRPVCVKGYDAIVIPDGYEAWIYSLDKNKTHISAVGWWKSGKVMFTDILTDATKYINFAIRNTATPDSNISGEIGIVENGLILDENVSELKSALTLFGINTNGNICTITDKTRNLANVSTLSQMTKNGLSWSVDEQGQISIHGTATAQQDVIFYLQSAISLEESNYTLSFAGDFAVDGNYRVFIGTGSDSGYPVYEDSTTNTVTFTNYSGVMARLLVRIPNGRTINFEGHIQFEKGSVATNYIPHYTAQDLEARERVAVLEGEFINFSHNQYFYPELTWNAGYITTFGEIRSSSVSQYATVPIKKGETVVVGTRNKGICVIGKSNSASPGVGDHVEVLRRTSSVNQFETYEYTAEEDAYITVCMLQAEYKLGFLKEPNIYDNFSLVKLGILGYSAYLGNAITAQFNSGEVLLVDSFSVEAWNDLKADLNNRGISKIDYFMLTHWHGDHAGNIPNLINNGYIDENTKVYLPQILHSEIVSGLPSDWSTVVERQNTITQAIENCGATIIYPNEGNEISIGQCKIEFWNTDHSQFYPSGSYASNNYNDWSLCANLLVGEESVCFTGDIGYWAQKKMADLGTLRKANIMTAPHHGWQNMSAAYYHGLVPGFINFANPDVVFSEDFFVHDNYINTPYCAIQTWCERNGIANYSTRINGSMNVAVSKNNWYLLGAYTNYIRGSINWFYDYGLDTIRSKIAYLSASLTKPLYSKNTGNGVLRSAVANLLDDAHNSGDYTYAFRVRVTDSDSDESYLEMVLKGFVPGVTAASTTVYKNKNINYSGTNPIGTIAVEGITGTPQFVVEIIEFSATA